MTREPALDRYEARYRLTGRAAAGLAASVLLVAVVFLSHLPVIFLPLSIILAAVITRDAGLIDCARRATAFRADRAGITLGALREKLSVRRGSALFIPWTDIEGIVLYQVHPRRWGGHAALPCIGVQRRAAAAPLRWGNEAAPGCPVPRVATWAARPITGWRLDRQRLAAVTAAVAPGIPIVDTSTDTGTDTSTGPGPAAHDPGQEASAPEAGPTDAASCHGDSGGGGLGRLPRRASAPPRPARPGTARSSATTPCPNDGAAASLRATLSAGIFTQRDSGCHVWRRPGRARGERCGCWHEWPGWPSH